MNLIEKIDLMAATHVVETGKYPKYLIVGGNTLYILQSLLLEMMNGTSSFEPVEAQLKDLDLDTVCGLKVIRVNRDAIELGV